MSLALEEPKAFVLDKQSNIKSEGKTDNLNSSKDESTKMLQNKSDESIASCSAPAPKKL